MQKDEEYVAGIHVSRETIADLRAFAALVERWNPAINLVSKASLPDLWDRHIIDSAQVFQLCPPDAALWLDIGSGGGFPGIVVAVLAKELKPTLKVAMVESDLRKATFLREACRTLGLNAEVLSARIESLKAMNADVLSARALAPLSVLLGYASQHLAEDGTAVFLKGERYDTELAEARKSWSFEVNTSPSYLDKSAAILEIRKIRRA